MIIQTDWLKIAFISSWNKLTCLLNPLYPRLICTKSSGNWPCGFMRLSNGVNAFHFHLLLIKGMALHLNKFETRMNMYLHKILSFHSVPIHLLSLIFYFMSLIVVLRFCLTC